MSTNLCCLCCRPCSYECKHLQNDLGECNEIYEITVKYFDPMLLVEHFSTNAAKESCVLCQNCWSHIQIFDDFRATIINERTSLDHLFLQQSSLEFEAAKVLQIFTTNPTDDHSEGLKRASNDAENKIQLEEDLQTLNDCGVDTEQINTSGIDIPCSKTAAEIKTDERSYLEKTHKMKSKLRKQESLFQKAHYSNDSCAAENLPKFTNSFENHPALDKSRKYDKFIAEWKSQLECDICNKVFPIFDLLKAHFKEKHNAKGFVKCCDRKFDRRCSLVEHIRLHINPEMHKCDLCGKVIGSKYSLIHHKNTIHGESKKFKCNKCPKIFKQKQNLKCHLLTHVTGSKDFKCEECDKAYVHEFQLKKHIKLVHMDNRVCDQCGKTLHGIGALKNHLKEHDNIEKVKFPWMSVVPNWDLV